MSQENIALWIIVVQGFFVMFFEWGVWWIKYSENKDRRKWREDKRKAMLKKLEKEAKLFFSPETTVPKELVPLLPGEKPKEEPHA